MKKCIIGILVLTMLLCGCASYLEDGVMLLEEGKYEEAIKEFESQIEKEKQLDEAYRGIAIANYELGNYEEVVGNFEKALEYEAEATLAMYHLMASACMKCEDYENAMKYYDLVLGMEDCTEEIKKEILFNKISIHEMNADWESAKEAVNTYLEIYPDDESVIKEAEFLQTR